MRPRVLICLLALLIAGLSATEGRACTCGGYSSGDEAFKRSHAVFLGEVAEISPILFRDLTEAEKMLGTSGPTGLRQDMATDYQVRLLVQEAWKGLDRQEEAFVLTTMSSASCGFPFQVGKRYVVFAHQAEDSLRASICSATDILEDSGPMVRYLRRKAQGDLRSLIAGRIGAWDSDDPAGMVGDTTGQLIPVTLSLQGPGVIQRISPQEGGRFEFDGLRPGVYTLRLELPSDYDPYPVEYRVELADPIDFADVDVHSPNLSAGAISLRIRDAAGRLLPTMSLLLNDSKGRAYIEKGVLQAKHLSPGQYSLALPLDGSSAGGRLYYPDGRSSDEAQIIDVEAGQITRLPDWHLPFEIEPVLLEGVVLLPDGRPASNALVALNAGMLEFWTGADLKGRFQLAYYLPFRYRLEASGKDTDQGKTHWLAPMPWPPEEPPSGPVRLILQ